MVMNAGSTLSFWNMGLRAQPRPIFKPAPVSAVGECTEVPRENAVAQVLDRVKLRAPACCSNVIKGSIYTI